MRPSSRREEAGPGSNDRPNRSITGGNYRMSLSKKFTSVAATLALLTAGVIGAATTASAHTPSVSSSCDGLNVDLKWYTPGTPGVAEVPASTIHHNAVTHTDTIVDSEAYDDEDVTIPGQWWNWSPNNSQGPQDYIPAFPTDERGTWQGPHTEGGPKGEGTFQTGGGNSPFFHREADTTIPGEHHNAVTHDVTVTDQEAYDEAVPGTPGTPGTANTVTVIIDGATIVDAETFASSYSNTFPYGDPTVEHTYKVKVRAWDDPQGANGWSANFTGTQGVCQLPPPIITPTVCDTLGSHVVDSDGVIDVAGDWDEGTIPLGWSGTLKDVGTVFDLNATQEQYLGLHIHTTEGTIVYEDAPGYNGRLWSKTKWAGVEGDFYGTPNSSFGTIEEYVALNGDVAVTGIDVLYTSPEASSTTVESVTIGCTVFTFHHEVIVEPTEATPVFTPVDVCGVENDEFFLGTAPEGSTDYGTEGIEYSYDGEAIATATPLEGYKIVLPEGSPWTLNEDGTATLDVTPFFTDEPCATTPPPPPAQTCDDFATQAEAQAAYLAGNTALDGDKDGIACESLPNPTPSATPSPSATPVVAVVTPKTPTLASTGSEWLPIAAAGIVLLVAGGALVITRRRNATI